jgi:queuine tRNA-ribosyltransferase
LDQEEKAARRSPEHAEFWYIDTVFAFAVEARSSGARCGCLRTPHGEVKTPAFMPVATLGSVKALTQRQVEETGAEIVLANTYHLMLRPGAEKVAAQGGLHEFMGWKRPILTDSGGFQVASLAPLRRVTEEGVLFRSHLDGSSHWLTPERAVAIQELLGSDIAMVLDECVLYPATGEEVPGSGSKSSLGATHSRPVRAGIKLCSASYKGVDVRLSGQRGLVDLGFDGYGIGGLSVGEPTELTRDMTETSVAELPQEKPRYLMGVGTPGDLIESVARGIDLFDCVLPTRNARNGSLFTSRGKLSIKSARFAETRSRSRMLLLPAPNSRGPTFGISMSRRWRSDAEHHTQPELLEPDGSPPSRHPAGSVRAPASRSSLKGYPRPSTLV